MSERHKTRITFCPSRYNPYMSKITGDLIRAAGGLIWRTRTHHSEIMLIHRPCYNDWTLPKGKLGPGERWEEAALREVAEETGLLTCLDGFAGVLHYIVKDRPKVVLFWNMRPVGRANGDLISPSPNEVDQIAWLRLPEALRRMSYPDEKDLLQKEARRLKMMSP